MRNEFCPSTVGKQLKRPDRKDDSLDCASGWRPWLAPPHCQAGASLASRWGWGSRLPGLAQHCQFQFSIAENSHCLGETNFIMLHDHQPVPNPELDKQLSKVDAPYFNSGLPLASVGRLFGPNELFQPSCLEGVTLGSGFVPKANAELQTPCINTHIQRVDQGRVCVKLATPQNSGCP